MVDLILILDFGSQYTQLIAKKLRKIGVYSEILPYNTPFNDVISKKPVGVILSGGPQSVYSKSAPKLSWDIEALGVPILGICYGMQLLAYLFKGRVSKAKRGEYGNTVVEVVNDSVLFEGVGRKTSVWMSHSDEVEKLPVGFSVVAVTENGIISAMENKEKRLYAVQFHPEVEHTYEGKKILENFAFNVCSVKNLFRHQNFIEEAVCEIKKTVANSRAICALSGGVDSSVAAFLAHKAIGKRLFCIFVDTGLLRIGDRERIERVFKKKFDLNINIVDASDIFLRRLRGVRDPERKRKIIGKTFIDVFLSEARKIDGVEFLIQGTLYPDIIESVSVKGPSAVIKSHHNVGGLPKKVGFKIVEPLKYLFKDDVREVGKILNIDDEILNQHPFPGPGLAIRIIGEVRKDRLDILRRADFIVREELKRYNYYSKIWQAFCVLLPVKSVGVMGDERSYENVLALRFVDSVDGMTADWSKLPYDLLDNISRKIIGEVRGINRVVYDITSKPPATIEWE